MRVCNSSQQPVRLRVSKDRLLGNLAELLVAVAGDGMLELPLAIVIATAVLQKLFLDDA